MPIVFVDGRFGVASLPSSNARRPTALVGPVHGRSFASALIGTTCSDHRPRCQVGSRDSRANVLHNAESPSLTVAMMTTSCRRVAQHDATGARHPPGPRGRARPPTSPDSRRREQRSRRGCTRLRGRSDPASPPSPRPLGTRSRGLAGRSLHTLRNSRRPMAPRDGTPALETAQDGLAEARLGARTQKHIANHVHCEAPIC